MHRSKLAALAGLLLCTAQLLSGQAPDSVTVVAGAQYWAGPTRQLFLGPDYRDLWTTPIRAEVLDPTRFAGGLTPTQRGGGRQTLSIRMRGRDGREYVFRTVDKDATGGLPVAFRETAVDDIVQDQTAAKHPGAALVVPPLLQVAGVLHARPRLVVMPDHPFLGEHRREFAGRLGIIEERPDDEGDGPTMGGAKKIAGTEKLLENLEESSKHRVDSRNYLAARLMDIFMGDWDRHEDQWRWARFDRDGVHVWRPIPRDRDNAFVDYEGLLQDVARRTVSSKWVTFGPEYPSIGGLTANARAVDRRVLAELPRPAWDSMATRLQAGLTDAVIESAVRRMPPEYYALSGVDLTHALKARRDRLHEAASKFYTLLAPVVDVHATDEREVAEVDRLPTGHVDVRVYRADKESGRRSSAPYFQRRFVPEETREIRIRLQGGADQAIVRGTAEHSIRVRVLGGGGDDVLADSSRVNASRGYTVFHDYRGDNRIVAGPGTRVDRRPPVQSEETKSLINNAPGGQDRGVTRSLFTPWAGWKSNVGVVVGGGPNTTRYSFQRDPYVYRMGLRGLYAPQHNRFALEASGDFRRRGSDARLDLFARASQMEVTRFHGLGNETGITEDSDLYKVWHTEYLLQPSLDFPVASAVRASVGPVLKYSAPELRAGSPVEQLRPRGSEAFGQLGAQAVAEWDRRDSEVFPTRGFRLRAGGSAYPVVWGDAADPFGETHVRGHAYLPVPLPLQPTLAVRAGASRAWGDYPFQEAAYLGGSSTLRGYHSQRFVGDAAIYGNAELRVPLTRGCI